MPSTATITAFNVFSAGTLIRSAAVNANFDNFRGHLIPIDPSTATAASTLTYDLGKDDCHWNNVYQGISVYVAQSTPSVNPSTTTKYKIYMKSDGNLYKLNSLGAEGAIGSGGGGGGGSLTFVEGANAPVKTFENEINVYEFEPGQNQALYLAIRVPTSYSAGSPINLRILWTCAATANDALINAVATLIRSEVDEITSTTNQRTTTNSAITMSSSNDLEPQKITLDIASSVGQINGVNISAGDLIKVKIQESSSTVNSVIKLIPDASEVTFT